MPAADIIIISSFFLGLSGILRARDRRLVPLADKLAIMISPLILVLVSLSVVTRKVGGTVMFDQHGWPHFWANYLIKDILDDSLIRKWHLAVGSLGSYLILNYLFYLSIALCAYFLIRIWVRSEAKATIGLFFVLGAAAAGLFSSQYFKEAYIQREITQANYCQADADCVDAGSQCPFGCYAYVNQREASRISGLISSYRSGCVYSCLACPTAACVDHQCQPVCED